jgi:malonyl CoA-acyl carrier protein transacylase
MKTYMFPGQGAQARGMGSELFDAFPDLTAQADAILGYSIRELCLDDPRSELNKTQFTQPAMFVVNAMSYLRKLGDAGEPDYVAGHSLGEFNALLAAEVFDFETGLRLVKKRGELMGQIVGGAMAAVLNASREELEDIVTTHGLANVDLANYNSPTQIVISGAAEDVAKVQHCLKPGMSFFPLKTSGPFHSRFMRPAQEAFSEFLKSFELAAPRFPVISNVTARPHAADALASTLANQIASTVRWTDSIQYLLDLHGGDMRFEEIGPGQILTKLLRSIKENHVPSPVAAASNAQPAEPVHRAEAAKTDVAELIREWNARYPVGTKVKTTMPGYGELETCSQATILFGRRAAVYMKGYKGYFELNEVQPA